MLCAPAVLRASLGSWSPSYGYSSCHPSSVLVSVTSALAQLVVQEASLCLVAPQRLQCCENIHPVACKLYAFQTALLFAEPELDSACLGLRGSEVWSTAKFGPAGQAPVF